MRNKHFVTRRNVLKMGAASLSGLGIAAGSRLLQSNRAAASAFTAEMADATPLEAQPSLRSRAAAKGLIYGAASGYPVLSSDTAFRDRFIAECGCLVTENELKWESVRPGPDRFDFTEADWMANFAQSHNMAFRGHTLIWKWVPDWAKAAANRQTAEGLLVKHVETAVKHFAGRVHSWDVVNEAVEVSSSRRADGLDDSLWLEFLGKDYIDLAFRVAAEADPQAMLVYNDRYVDYNKPFDNDQRRAILNLLEYLKGKGTPVHALGIQAHLNGSETTFDARIFRDFLSDVASLGFKILITELDVIDRDLPADIAQRDRRIAEVYRDYLTATLEEPAVISVITWGLSDRYTWLSHFHPRPDGLPVRPLPLDADLNRKPAWSAIAQAFDQASRR